jgi:hypothetical protein
VFPVDGNWICHAMLVMSLSTYRATPHPRWRMSTWHSLAFTTAPGSEASDLRLTYHNNVGSDPEANPMTRETRNPLLLTLVLLSVRFPSRFGDWLAAKEYPVSQSGTIDPRRMHSRSELHFSWFFSNPAGSRHQPKLMEGWRRNGLKQLLPRASA